MPGAIKSSLLGIHRGLNTGLVPAERFLCRGSAKDLEENPPLFLLGPPRCGSTLWSQLLLNQYAFGYLSRAHARLYGFPALLNLPTRLGWMRHSGLIYESRYGRSFGWRSPDEAGAFWDRWFPPPTNPDHANRQRTRLIRVLASLTKSWQSSLLIKNLFLATGTQSLAEAFPKAVFCLVEREPIWVAQSIWSARKSLRSDPSRWWSTRPADYEHIRLFTPAEQVAAQVLSLYQTLRQDLRIHAPSRHFSVRYADFCANPQDPLQQCQDAWENLGIRVPTLGPVITQLENRNQRKIPESEFLELQEALDELAPNYPDA